MLDEMLIIYQEFVAEDFCVQLSPHSFSRVETDKVIETTINWDTKTPGGLKGFSTKINTVNRWILNPTNRASMRRCFHKMLDHQKYKSNKHSDLYRSCIKRDTEDACNVVEHLSDTLQYLCISNGLVATEEVCESLINAKTHGGNAMTMFMKQRLEEGSTIDFLSHWKNWGRRRSQICKKLCKLVWKIAWCH